MLNIDIPISLGIFALFFRSLYEIISHTGPGYFDSLGGLLFFLMLGKYFQQKTYTRLSFEHDYKSFFPLACIVDRDGTDESVPIINLVPGDTVVIRNEEIVPADAVLETDRTMIDYSFVTGESTPVEKYRGDIIFAGGKVCGMAIKAQVLKPASQSYLTQLWNDDAFKKTDLIQYQNITDRISKYFTPIVLILALVGFITWSFLDMTTAYKVLVSVLIIACPCALALSAPFTYGAMMHWLGKRGFYVKNVDVIDKIARVDTIVFDKTGTLTSTEEHSVDFSSLTCDSYECKLIKTVCRNSTHPLSRMVYQAMEGDTFQETNLFDEIKGRGVIAIVDGKEVRIGSQNFIVNRNNDVVENNQSKVYVQIGEKNCGFISFKNNYRNYIDVVIRHLGKRYSLIVLSGDTDGEKERLESYFGKNAALYFEQKPIDKLNWIKKLQKEGAFVMMVGDGLNDAGALRQADVGVAVSEDASQFSPASDAIIEGKRISFFDALLDYSTDAKRILRNNLKVSLLYNVAGLSFALSGMLSPLVSAIFMPLSTITVVSFAVLQARMASRRLNEINLN
jgi:Cu+-exporting ATPase